MLRGCLRPLLFVSGSGRRVGAFVDLLVDDNVGPEKLEDFPITS